MAGEVAILLIDPNGLARQTEKAFRPLDRYLLSLQRRARQLGRMPITPFVRLVDKATERLNDLKNQLDAFSAKSWTVNLDPIFDMNAFTSKAEEAGSTFSDHFLLGFSPDSIASKVKEALKEVDLDIGVNVSNSPSDEKLFDKGLLKDIISGTAASLLSGMAFRGYDKYKEYRTKPKIPPGDGGPNPTRPTASAAAPKPGNSKVVEMDAYKKKQRSSQITQ